MYLEEFQIRGGVEIRMCGSWNFSSSSCF